MKNENFQKVFPTLLLFKIKAKKAFFFSNGDHKNKHSQLSILTLRHYM